MRQARSNALGFTGGLCGGGGGNIVAIAAKKFCFESVISKSPLRPFAAFALSQDASFLSYRKR